MTAGPSTRRSGDLRQRLAARPSLLVAAGFAVAIAIGTGLLLLPGATADGRTGFVPALFTATSAVCVTGLVVVDTGTHWTLFGQLVVLGLIQAGGLGIMTLASLLGRLVFRRFTLRMRLTAQAETKSGALGGVRGLVGRIVALSVLSELVVTAVLWPRLALGYGIPWGRAGYVAAFHAVSAFNNAGFSLYPDSLLRFSGDPLVCLPLAAAFITGGIGYPVLIELRRRFRNPRRLSVHTRITLGMTGVLIAAATVIITAAEWTNPGTLGPMSPPHKLLAGFFQAVTPRTAGFNSVDVGSMHPGTWLFLDVLMFLGGGSAGTAGGIKVTTFALLGFVILAEVRAEPTVHVLDRQLPHGVQRQALTVVLLGVGSVMAVTGVLLAMTPFSLDRVLFEVVSAFATVGLSTGITAALPPSAWVLLAALMFLGRLGPVTLASALALRIRTRRYELPEERPIVG